MFLLSMYVIFSRVTQRDVSFDTSFTLEIKLVLLLVSGLSVLNWYLEVKRWQLSFTSADWGFKDAFYDVFYGLAFNWVVPFTGGDYLARIRNKKDKKLATVMVVLNRGIMILFTAVFCIITIRHFFAVSLLVIASVSLIAIAVLYVALRSFRHIRRRIALTKGECLRLFLLSFLRYAVFTFQAFVVVWVFNDTLLPEVVFSGVAFIFFSRSVLPTFLGGIGVRESSGVLFFEPYVSNLSTIILPVTFIWIVNIVLPSVLGAFLVLRAKYALAK